MILYIILLILFLMILILINFFTVYFIIPSIKNNKVMDDPLIPKTVYPQKLPKQRLITPYETTDFIENLVKPIPMNEKIQMLDEMSENISKLSIINNKKGFKIWKYCYKILKHFN